MSAELLSNSLKAILYNEDYTAENSAPQRRDCYSVQQYRYDCRYPVDDNGRVTGQTRGVTLEMTVKILSPEQSKTFYKRLQSRESFSYTIFYNPVFDSSARLSKFDDCMLFQGYVVDIEEDFDTTPNSGGIDTQMLMKVRLLLTEIRFRSRNGQDMDLPISSF